MFFKVYYGLSTGDRPIESSGCTDHIIESILVHVVVFEVFVDASGLFMITMHRYMIPRLYIVFFVGHCVLCFGVG